MKTIRLFLMGLLLAITGIVHATDTLKVQDIEVAPGESIPLSIALDNETTNLMGWQCDIVLPEGFSLALKNNGKPSAMLGNRFSTTEHFISSTRLANGAYRFIATSMEGEAIPGNSGPLFTVTLLADTLLMPGTKPTGIVTNIEFNTQDNQRLTLADMTFTAAITGSIGQKCATPTIAYDNGELVFSCEMEGVTFVSEVNVVDAKTNKGERVQLTPTYVITVYATLDGYDNSDVATATIGWRNGRPVMEGFSSVTLEDDEYACDVNGDFIIDVADIATIISEMAKRARMYKEDL